MRAKPVATEAIWLSSYLGERDLQTSTQSAFRSNSW